jgi:hypothetical protein
MFDKEEYKKVINVPLSVIIGSFIIIVITSGMTDPNGLKALIGGYAGLLFGMLFIIILNYPPPSWLDMVPFIVIIILISLLIFYLSKYFDKISTGEVSSYYNSFSVLSTIFLATQIIILISAMFSNSGEVTSKMLSDKTFALVSLFGVINFLIVITIGIVLHFYSTQG